MLSRVADSIYWMARYVERAENLARLLLSTQDLLLDAGAEAAGRSAVLAAHCSPPRRRRSLRRAAQEDQRQRVVEFLALRADNPNSMLNSMRAARENARTVRDQISDEMWECMNWPPPLP